MPEEPRLKFRAVLRLDGKTATGIEVPPEIMAGLGGSKRQPVVVWLNGFAYRTTVTPYNGVNSIPVSAEVREKASIQAGDELDVEIEPDTQPREVEIPPDFAAALAQDAQAAANFAKLAYSHKRRHTLAIEEAKTPETRTRRIAKAIEALREGNV